MRRTRIPVHKFMVVLLALAWLVPHPGAAAGPSVADMAGAMIMVGFHGTSAPQSVIDAVAAGHLGGVILFDGSPAKGEYNIQSPEQVRSLVASLQKAAPRTLLVAVDQEGGKVRRLKPERGFLPLPSAEKMGGMKLEEVRELGFQTGREMASLGINVNLAPVVDLRRAKDSPGLGNAGRLFGSGSTAVTQYALAFADGLYRAGVLPALKHFPGLGSAGRDSHHELPDVTESWDMQELLPYMEAFRRGWPGMVLVGHAYHQKLDGRLPSSLSPVVVEEFLRRRLGWDGVVISDDLQMGAVAKNRSLEERVRLALLAGNDILLFGNNLSYDPLLHEKVFQAVMALVNEGAVSPQRLKTSWTRIEKMKRNLAESRGK